jgi:alpha-tubulin suppressor-like RCC1 family protein
VNEGLSDQYSQFTNLALGKGFVMATNSKGETYSWGCNSNGELGNGTFEASEYPQILEGISEYNLVRFGIGYSFVMAISYPNLDLQDG